MSFTEATGRRIDRLLGEYGESHQNHKNKAIHWICVPVIFWTVTALLWSVPTPIGLSNISPWLNWCTIGLGLSIIYYLSLSITLAIGMAVFSALMIWINMTYQQFGLGIPLWQTALAVFVIAWVGQFIGHHIEGKKPSFFKDLQFLLVGPAWLMHFIFKKIGIPY
ncbi:DUF962 domain-containing protein [Pseudovibrio sp. Ad37]|uniref:Mpo1 family 2-hydroxy fatty acid dioxygenase n=1 Tax=Pseudovibrio sp. Ad37 TaxID=989422 RepID=UPI0007AEC02A|nr:Mpo1-like protein [Pseudovibrio sp. Ad37]KZL27307.1 hypothetical protein PsAD37_01446 [Pseudovibrio sp. Ad37]